MQNENTWSTFDVANYLQVAAQTVRKWRHVGVGPRYHRLGGSRGPCRYRPEDVSAWLEERAASSTSEESARAAMAAGE
jgi:hypothetical protein